MKTTRILNAAPVQLEAIADKMNTTQRGEAARELEALALGAIWRAAYLDHRYGCGCGDQGHAASVKNANKKLTACRRALGFTYPDRGTIAV